MVYLTQQEIARLTAQPASVESPAILVSNIGSAASGIVNSLLTAFAGQTLDSLKPQIKNYIGGNMGLAQTLKTKPLSEIVNSIETQVDAEYKMIIDLMKGGIGQGVGGVHAGLFETLNGTGQLLQSYNGLIQRLGIDPYIARWVNNTINPNVLNTETAWFLSRLGKITSEQYNGLASIEGWDKTNANLLNEAWTQAPPLMLIYDLVRRKTIDIKAFQSLLRYFRLNDSAIENMTALIAQIPEPYRIADFAAKNLIDDSQSASAFEWFGLDKNWGGIYKESQMQIPSMSILAELLWRGQITKDNLTHGLIRSGIHPLFRDKMIALTELIPPANDIITMVVREAFETANTVSAPKEFSDWMVKKGYNNYWADKYWTSHFLPMPLAQAYDNLRRGLWDKAKFLDLLRIADVHPRWREDIYNVAFHPPSIREMGYGYDVGAFTKDDIVKYRRWGGLSAVDAEKTAQSLIDYRLDAERNALRTGNMNLYINGKITKEALKQALTTLRTNTAAIELWLQRAEILIQLKATETSVTEPKNVTRSDIQWLFENGLRNESWFKETLKDIGYSDDSINAYLEQSKKRIADKLVPPAVTVPKSPSIAQLTSFYDADLINDATLITRITELNYSQTDASTIAQLIRMGKPVKEKQLTISQLSKLYYDGEVDETTLFNRLKSLNYNDSDANSLIQLISIASPTAKAPPTTSLSELEELYKYGYFDEKELMAQYENRGYSHSDAVLKTYLTVLSVRIPTLTAQYRNAWIGEADLYDALMKINIPFEVIGIPEKRVNEMMLSIVKNTKAERTAPEKDLTKAEIIKGAKNNVFTIAQAVELLENLGYSEDEANYLLAINKIIAIQDPRGYWDIRQATELYKKAQGIPSIDIPNELIELEAKWKESRSKLKIAKESKAPDTELGALAVQTANIEAQMGTIKSRLKIR